MESEHYKPLFPDCEVIGLDYQTFTPWETGKEIHIAVEELKSKYENVILIANSIGAFFSMIATPHFDHGSKNAGIDDMIQKAYFISPIVDMERLNGYELTGEWFRYVRNHPTEWNVPTQILYGSKDHLMSIETITDFANKHQVTLTVMDGGEHWFHTEEQMAFMDNWIEGD